VVQKTGPQVGPLEVDTMRMKLTLASLALFGLTLMAASCGSSYSSPTTPTPPGGGGGGTADVTITIVGMSGNQSFSPDPATVRVGQTVAWRNADSIAHNPAANSGAFNTGLIQPGSTSSPITMTAAGSIGYHCLIHPDMVGTLSVTQ